MLRPLIGLLLCKIFAQGVCIYPQESPLVSWVLYHPLEWGKGEKIARLVAEHLFADSVLREVAYIHSIKYALRRKGPWFCVEGQATPEGLYAFFSALQGALQRFSQRLSGGLRASPEQAPDPLLWSYRLIYEDTTEGETSPVAISQAFFRYWREGQLRCVLQGRVASPLSRVVRQLVGEPQPLAYIPPPLPSPLYRAPRQGAGIVYIRWQVRPPLTLNALVATWYQAQNLQRYLCEDRQLACQATWVPLPTGLELWIETSLPAATEHAAQEFLQRPLRPSASVGNAFISWVYNPASGSTGAWWACVWNLPTLPTTPPALSGRDLVRQSRNWKVVITSIGG